MNDESYLYISDVKDKKRTARGAHNKRTHTGKGGRVRFPSDYMSRKDRERMNGEIMEYRLNSPVTWAEFKGWPDDIKAQYIKLLQKTYKAGDSAMAEMLGVGRRTMMVTRQKLGIQGLAQGTRPSKGWQDFLRGAPCRGEEAADDTADDSKRYETAPIKEEPPAAELAHEQAMAASELEYLRQENRNLVERIRILEAQIDIVKLIFGGGR